MTRANLACDNYKPKKLTSETQEHALFSSKTTITKPIATHTNENKTNQPTSKHTQKQQPPAKHNPNFNKKTLHPKSSYNQNNPFLIIINKPKAINSTSSTIINS